MTDAGIDPRSFRTTLGRFTTGVTVVTTTVQHDVHGMTANAFTSVSLDPPLVLVSVSAQARMHGHLLAMRRHGISVLSTEQEALAWHFAGRPRDGLTAAFVWKREVPLLANALAHLVCTVEATYPGGDHTLFLSRVEELWSRDGSPLTFYTGRFFGLIPLPAGEWRPAEELVLDGGDEQGERPPEAWW